MGKLKGRYCYGIAYINRTIIVDVRRIQTLSRWCIAEEMGKQEDGIRNIARTITSAITPFKLGFQALMV